MTWSPVTTFVGLVLAALVPVALGAQGLPEPGSPDPETARTLPIHDSVWLEELTWLEVRDLMRAGRTTVLIPTGGVEQNGPNLVLGKHNIILRATMDAVARQLGDALVAPVVPFVPEGDIDPPSGHMRYPGTVSVTQETFRALLTDLARSMKTHGFRNVVLLGDSGGNQAGMGAVAEALAKEWAGSGTEIMFIPEYYDNERWNAWLAEQGVKEELEGLHDDVRHSSIMMLVNPEHVRASARMAAGTFQINGVELAPVEKTQALARRLVDYQAQVTVAAIRKRIAGR
ncbi:MAG TPA: creatininase family protein [Longimicrobiales bacterium]|nr:creatininase family protein [Longimicrobiales bacterium]